MNTGTEYTEVYDVLRMAARAWAARTGADYQDLLGLADEIYCEALQDYDPSRGASFRTYLIHRLRLSRRWSWIPRGTGRGEAEHLAPIPATDGTEAVEVLPSPSPSPYRQVLLQEILEGLSEDGREVVSLALSEDPLPDVDGSSPPRKIRGAIVRELRRRGWALSRIWAALSEVKQAVNSDLN